MPIIRGRRMARWVTSGRYPDLIGPGIGLQTHASPDISADRRAMRQDLPGSHSSVEPAAGHG